MKILIVEDDFASRKLLHDLLEPYGHCDLAINGLEAVEAFGKSLKDESHYDLICLDIKMPEMDGHEALAEIRKLEAEAGIHGSDGTKIIMTTALSESENIMKAFKNQCEAYLVKPIQRTKLYQHLEELELLDKTE